MKLIRRQIESDAIRKLPSWTAVYVLPDSEVWYKVMDAFANIGQPWIEYE